jgi:crotonobetaine/carnitine-CoA ligase
MTEDYFPLRELTVAKVLAAQRQARGGKVFLTELWTGRQWTYAQLDDMVDRAAHVLLEAGIFKGMHVGLLMGNSAEHLAIFLALGKIGAVSVPVNTAARGELLRYYFDHADAAVIVVDEELAPRLDEVRPLLP